MRKFNVTKMETVFFKGAKKTATGKATRWPLFLLFLFIMGSANAQVPTLNYGSPQTYTQNTAITPLVPTADGVAPFAYSRTKIVVQNEFIDFDVNISGLAFDSNNNLFLGVADHVDEFPGGGSYFVHYKTGFKNVSALATDAQGNLYVTDATANALYKMAPGGGTVTTLSTAFPHADGVAVDALGNVYVMSGELGKLWKMPVNGGIPVPLTVGTASHWWGGLAADRAGNIYVSDRLFGIVYKLPAGGGPAVTIGSGFAELNGLVIDPAGNIFVLNNYGNISMIPAGGGSAILINSNIDVGTFVTLDNYGDLYFIAAGQDDIEKINRAGGYFISPALPLGLNFDENTGIISGTPTVVGAATNYTATAYNSSGKTSKTINIKISPYLDSHYAKLAQLKLSRGELSPVYSLSATNYTATVVNGVRSITATPVTASPLAKVKINGYAVESGEAWPMALAVGANIINVVVTAPDGVTTQTYTITVNRPGTSSDDLLSLTRSAGLISPVFSALTTSYTSNVVNEITQLKVTPTAFDPDAIIKINGASLTPPIGLGQPSATVPLSVGVNAISIVVTSSDGTATKTYTLTVTRAVSDNANLSYLYTSLNPLYSFSPINYSYDFTVAHENNTITVSPTTAVPVSTVKVNGVPVSSGSTSSPISLANGLNTINAVVTALDGVTTKTYALNVTRIGPVNPFLASLIINPTNNLTPVIKLGTTSYAAPVSYKDSVVTMTPITSDPGATVTINGVVVATGIASGPIKPALGHNYINIVVTASNGKSSKTYVVDVFRYSIIQSDAHLSTLSVKDAALTPVFASNTFNYTVTIPSSLTRLTLRYNPDDEYDEVVINGGSYYPNYDNEIPLSPGTNTITLKVYSEDKINSDISLYTITVMRYPLSNNDKLSSLVLTTAGTLSPAFAPATTNYTVTMTDDETAFALTPTASDPGAVITVNGASEVSGQSAETYYVYNKPVVLKIVVKSSDGTASKTYTVTANRPDPILSALKISHGVLDSVFVNGVFQNRYTVNVANSVSSVTLTPTLSDSQAIIIINNAVVSSGIASAPIPLSVGSNTIQLNVDLPNFEFGEVVTVTRASGPVADFNAGISESAPQRTPVLANDGIVVHSALSPNGDGINDFLIIDGIQAYPDNKLSVMNRNGQLIFEAKGYDNASKVFDGRSNKTGQMQLPGTYFYSLEYTVKGVTKHKTGYLVLKY